MVGANVTIEVGRLGGGGEREERGRGKGVERQGGKEEKRIKEGKRKRGRG